MCEGAHDEGSECDAHTNVLVIVKRERTLLVGDVGTDSQGVFVWEEFKKAVAWERYCGLGDDVETFFCEAEIINCCDGLVMLVDLAAWLGEEGKLGGGVVTEAVRLHEVLGLREVEIGGEVDVTVILALDIGASALLILGKVGVRAGLGWVMETLAKVTEYEVGQIATQELEEMRALGMVGAVKFNRVIVPWHALEISNQHWFF